MTDIKESMKKRYKYYTTEWCPHCDREVRVPARVKPIPSCPRCRKPCIPCSACDHQPDRCVDCEDGGKFKLHPGEKVKKTGFRLDKIIKIADKAYPSDDNEVLHEHQGWKDVGDTLAKFIALELKDTYDAWASKEEQLLAACEALGKGRAQLENVECALKERWRKLHITKMQTDIRRKEERCRKKRSKSKGR